MRAGGSEKEAASTVTAVVCRSRGRAVAVPIEHVIETMRPLPIEALRDAPPFVLGLAIVRGAPVPVLDLAAALGDTDAGAPPGRFVTVRAGARAVALAVDAVVGVRSVPGAELATLPPLLQAAAAQRVSAVGMLDAELLLVLDAARVVPEGAETLTAAETSA